MRGLWSEVRRDLNPFANSIHYKIVIHKEVFKISVHTSKKEYKKNFLVRPGARTPTYPPSLRHCRFAPPSPTVRTSLLLSDDVCRRCNLTHIMALVVKLLQAPIWRPCALAPGGICIPLPPYATPLRVIRPAQIYSMQGP